MKKRLVIKNTFNEDCVVYKGSCAMMSIGNSTCTGCRTHRILDSGTVVFKLDDYTFKSFKKGEQVPFAYL